jgi:sec-independent protein translocase protein TatA
MPSIGWQELVIVLVIVLVIFGPKRLPEIGRSLGKGLKEFKSSASELQDHLTKEENPAPVEKTEATTAGKAESSEQHQSSETKTT